MQSEVMESLMLVIKLSEIPDALSFSSYFWNKLFVILNFSHPLLNVHLRSIFQLLLGYQYKFMYSFH